jgi:hypothetical protein
VPVKKPAYHCFHATDADWQLDRSWITYFFRSHYNVEEGLLGSIFFGTNIISAMSMLVASALTRRFGNVNVRCNPPAPFLRLTN